MAIGMQSGCFAACPFTPFDIFHSIAPYRICHCAAHDCMRREGRNECPVRVAYDVAGGRGLYMGFCVKGIETPAVQALPG